MKTIISIFCVLLFLQLNNAESAPNGPKQSLPYSVIRAQSGFNANNISTWVWNTGVFNQDMRTNNTPGFEWPKGSGKFAIFTTGLSIASYVNNDLRLASISYNGEYAPGYSNAGVSYTSSTFKLYKISRGDNSSNNPDYANWGLMVPYGAPYIDIDGNGQFNPLIDKPGVRGAGQTIFECITDGFPENHTSSEGFSGGTFPLFSEMHLTAWSYDSIAQLTDVQFIKMEIINKNTARWDSTYFGIMCDADLGDNVDDYIGCDEQRNMGYCYNYSDQDGNGSGRTYGAHPPAVGIDLLKGAHSNNLFPADIGMSSFDYFTTGGENIYCETDPVVPISAYNYLRGFKKDNTPWVNVSNSQLTKFCYSGDPESNTGWTEYTGAIKNCGGITTGLVEPCPPGERRFLLNSGSSQLHVNQLDTQKIVLAQMIARGSNNKNSVTKLKQLDDFVQTFYDNNFVISVNYISNEVPDKFSLYQNYPNPFNPSTKIKFEITKSDFVKLTVYDLSGKVIDELVNEKLNEGIYEVNFTAKNISSGVYFYRLSTADFIQTNRMILVK